MFKGIVLTNHPLFFIIFSGCYDYDFSERMGWRVREDLGGGGEGGRGEGGGGRGRGLRKGMN